jgi:hypothetical protein
MPDRHMPVSRRFDLSKGVPRAWPLAWVPHTSSEMAAKRTVGVSWGQRVLSVVMVGTTLVTGLMTLAVTPAAAAASAAPAPVTAYVTNSGSGLNKRPTRCAARRACSPTRWQPRAAPALRGR